MGLFYTVIPSAACTSANQLKPFFVPLFSFLELGRSKKKARFASRGERKGGGGRTGDEVKVEGAYVFNRRKVEEDILVGKGGRED